MQLTALQVGILLKGTVEGNPEVTVNQLAKIEDAKQGSLSFLANSKYEQFLYGTGASIIIVNNDFVPAQPVSATLIRVKDSYSAFSVLLEKYDEL
jgi:UDP-3-O-[3-hydroxymyristoyl] glucosamine N-acyltransferase